MTDKLYSIFSNPFEITESTLDNKSSSVISWDDFNSAYETMKKFMDFDDNTIHIQPNIRTVPPEIIVNEQKYWVPYGNIAVPVKEEVEYKFVYKLQGYLRNKRQNVSLPRFRSAL